MRVSLPENAGKILLLVLAVSVVVSAAPIDLWSTTTSPVTVQSPRGAEITLTGGTADVDYTELFPQTVTEQDTFEDGDITEYSGDTGSFTADTNNVYVGTYSLSTSSGDATIYSQPGSGLPDYYDRGDGTLSYYTQVRGAGGVSILHFFRQDSNDYYRLDVNAGTGQQVALKEVNAGSVTTLNSQAASITLGDWYYVQVDADSDGSITVTVEYASNGTQVASFTATDSTFSSGGVAWRSFSNNGGFAVDFDHATIQKGSNNHALAIYTTKGNMTVESPNGRTSANVDFGKITGARTELWEIELNGNGPLTIDPEDKNKLNVSGGLDRISYGEVNSSTIGDGQPDFTVSGPDGSSATLTFYGLPANTLILAVNDSTGTALARNTTDSAGRGTFTIGLSTQTVRLLTVTGVPEVSNPSPTGQQDKEPDFLSVDVADPDFPNDKVNVTFWHNGERISSQSISSNQTVTAPIDTVQAGPNDWRVNATDEGGLSTEKSYTYSVNSTIFIRPETNESRLITNTKIKATFYGTADEEVIFTTNVSDGTLNISGLPVSQPFILELSAPNGGWYGRTGYSSSLFTSNTMYLLNSTYYPNAPLTIFELQDRTGRFPAGETTIRVERALDPDGDNKSNWQTVSGDFFGATGTFGFRGQQNVRYRIWVRNTETGEERLMGPYSPDTADVRQLEIGEVAWPALNGSATWFNTELNNSTGNTSTLTIKYADSGNNTDSITWTVRERFNESNVIASGSGSGPFGKYVATVAVNDSVARGGLVVEYQATKSDGTTKTGSRTVGSSTLPLPIDSRWLGSIALVFIPMVGLMYGSRTALIGAWAMVGTTGALMLVGWISLPVPALGAGVIITFGATLRATKVERGGLP